MTSGNVSVIKLNEVRLDVENDRSYGSGFEATVDVLSVNGSKGPLSSTKKKSLRRFLSIEK